MVGFRHFKSQSRLWSGLIEKKFTSNLTCLLPFKQNNYISLTLTTVVFLPKSNHTQNSGVKLENCQSCSFSTHFPMMNLALYSPKNYAALEHSHNTIRTESIKLTSKNQQRQRLTVVSPHIAFAWASKCHLLAHTTKTTASGYLAHISSAPDREEKTIHTSRWQQSVFIP